jgi:predicted Fe-Mo cluster-binding NifX family protein
MAPVFDTARDFLVVEVGEDGRVAGRQEVRIEAADIREKIGLLKRSGMGTLVCGAISRLAQEMAAAEGVELLSFVAGDVERVIEGWLNNDLGKESFAMPGCCGRRRRAGCGRQLRKGAGGGGRRGPGGPQCRGA